ncbi:pyruvate decarboxylase [Ameyamaea chiangmaiensis NBRC 103196]|uniref:pyruvate decarboxylase n=1 Tax=Ameyamaea chiangmaiensis TaxID=442969 RepID=A0A850PBI3_9PROT|nr:thiamine pyrophosphate-dependent enzyme [Ameyamaea chiangmaiensis]MBS4073620.1 alpha-keto acid decarboxylase family protein [Ameyamaea chiangmaiensis]NVN40039.1 alpha-keto acid decarboxylase family protein [Ameyamaea chiangmaiensis]GBQ69045.1 pyruvate decarboxylase [Ameyamaea chiangmaiensis NBRC 103196]
MTYTIGMYLAERLAQIGLKHHFAVAGDYNLVLLDQLLLNKDMEQIYCSNELNCGFSAEGYARANGAAAAVVTFSVGALSAFNAIGGAFAENLPVILISGAPNTGDHGTGRILHHTLGTSDYGYQREIAKHLTCAAESILSAEEAPAKIDHVIRTALREKKPAYLEIACNIADAECVRPGGIDALLAGPAPDRASLDAAVDAGLAFLEAREDVALLVGSKVRALGAQAATVGLADALGCAVATMAAAKSFFPETHPGYRGLYWGEVSSPGVQSMIDDAQGVICVGPIFNDYATVGWTAWPKGDNVLLVEAHAVTIDGVAFAGLDAADFLETFAARAVRRDASARRTQQYVVPEVAAQAPETKLTNAEMARQIGGLVTGNTTVLAETGDSWFNAVRMGLPTGARVELEMQWGHIGWSVPAAFGAALAAPERRTVLMVGDGSFQLTAQEVAQMIRNDVPVIIFLINNLGYTIEVMIHDGPYNNVKNWDYAGLMEVFNAGEGHGLGLRATTGGELSAAIERAVANTHGPTLIECRLDRDDCTEELVKWGKQVARANARKPSTH